MKAAVIGIGSNSVRMLLAEINGQEGRKLLRDREGTRLFAGLDAQGNLSVASMDAATAAVKRMAESARAQGAGQIDLFATSATRDAANQAAFTQQLLDETGLALHICSGEEEASLSFQGATDGEYWRRDRHWRRLHRAGRGGRAHRSTARSAVRWAP